MTASEILWLRYARFLDHAESGVVKETIDGEMVWTNHSTVFAPAEGARPLTGRQQHCLLKRQRAIDRLTGVQWV